MPAANESRVLVIYCGGTIGMLKSESQGYVPEPFYLTETLRAQARFHDPHEDSLFSHSNTVQGFRDWSQSGSSTPLRMPPTTYPQAEHYPMQTLLVRSSRPITLPQEIPCLPASPTCTKISDNCYEAHLPSLVTPVGDGPRIRYVVLEVPSNIPIQTFAFTMHIQWSPLLDSSNLEPSDWVRIAVEIELNYTFDAFVVLHGTGF